MATTLDIYPSDFEETHGATCAYFAIRNGRFAQVSQVDMAYAAGLFDGEGCVGFRMYGSRNYPSVRLAIANVNLDALNWLARTFGGKIYPHVMGSKSRRPCFTWNLNQRTLIEGFLRNILPYLIIKKRHAELVIKYCALHPLDGGSFKIGRYLVRDEHGHFIKSKTLPKGEIRLIAEVARLNKRGAAHARRNRIIAWAKQNLGDEEP